MCLRDVGAEIDVLPVGVSGLQWLKWISLFKLTGFRGAKRADVTLLG